MLQSSTLVFLPFLLFFNNCSSLVRLWDRESISWPSFSASVNGISLVQQLLLQSFPSLLFTGGMTMAVIGDHRIWIPQWTWRTTFANTTVELHFQQGHQSEWQSIKMNIGLDYVLCVVDDWSYLITVLIMGCGTERIFNTKMPWMRVVSACNLQQNICFSW